ANTTRDHSRGDVAAFNRGHRRGPGHREATRRASHSLSRPLYHRHQRRLPRAGEAAAVARGGRAGRHERAHSTAACDGGFREYAGRSGPAVIEERPIAGKRGQRELTTAKGKEKVKDDVTHFVVTTKTGNQYQVP